MPQAAKLPRTSGFFKKNRFSGKKTGLGREAVWDKWLLQIKVNSLPKVLPQAAKLPGTNGFFKKNRFPGKVLPQAAKLPGTSGLLRNKNPVSEKTFCPRQRSCPGQVACLKKIRFLRKSSAPGSEVARVKWLVQKKVSISEQK